MARRTFFSFHYTPDVWRAWNVRNCWVVKPEEQTAEGFFDSSVFEASKKESEENLKTFLRNGLKNTSVTCVLAGAETSARRWVRYEIVQSVLKGNGLLTVDIDKVKNKGGQTCTKGTDPLACVGLYKKENRIYFAEKNGEKWVQYSDYTRPIPESDLCFDVPTSDSVITLSKHYERYDFVAQDGRKNIAGWIELAAALAGR